MQPSQNSVSSMKAVVVKSSKGGQLVVNPCSKRVSVAKVCTMLPKH